VLIVAAGFLIADGVRALLKPRKQKVAEAA